MDEWTIIIHTFGVCFQFCLAIVNISTTKIDEYQQLIPGNLELCSSEFHLAIIILHDTLSVNRVVLSLHV